MNPYLVTDEWSIIEEGWHPEDQRKSESIFSIGNGRMGQRANFEEDYSGDSLQGSYLAGVYYPDKTRVGWWKNGYPEYFAKVLNAPNWIGIRVEIDGERIDLANCEVTGFRRVLNMKEGTLTREAEFDLGSNRKVKIASLRFCSLQDDEAGAIRYSVSLVNFSASLSLTPYLDGDVMNEDANYDEKFWSPDGQGSEGPTTWIRNRTRKSDFVVTTAMQNHFLHNGNSVSPELEAISDGGFSGQKAQFNAAAGDTVTLIKLAVNLSSQNHPEEELVANAHDLLNRLSAKGQEAMLEEHKSAWATRWETGDIVIEGDSAAQQGIRFNIFQLHQTYSGEDDRLNIGPKGFTGEKYGGSTYWDTEAYCLPFYLNTVGSEVALKLLKYRHKQLGKAIENAEKLGFSGGAALYPMVTMNGEECHNEWEITFEEIHRNGAIAFAIFNYVRHTDHSAYLAEYGFEVLVAISRFWSQRISWSEGGQDYVMLGVTGPNEYENNVNNNWYTNTIAAWTLEYTVEVTDFLQREYPERYAELKGLLNFREEEELARWNDIVKNIRKPQLEGTNIFLQQDGFMDKEQLTVDDLMPEQRPLNQHWSWDRILRSVFIKQADVLQGLYFLEDRFDVETIRENFEFYEPRTVHESSLSPCVHVVLASVIGKHDKAYELYLRTARLDLDDYNHEADEGLHITSMAGTWLAVVEGFGGMRVKNGYLSFNPSIPAGWNALRFKVIFRHRLLELSVDQNGAQLRHLKGEPLKFLLFDEPALIHEGESVSQPNPEAMTA